MTVISPESTRIARERLIVALDVSTPQAALQLVDQLCGQCSWFKVGLELFVAAGPSIVTAIKNRGHSVFLDLKLHDIPNTVASAVRGASGLGADLLTVHALGGPAMLRAAVEAAASMANPPRLLAVTVLTSMNQSQLESLGCNRTPEEQVALLAEVGLDAGLKGFVCSPREAKMLRDLAGPDATIVTPGIRPADADIGDQQRIATPTLALEAGASFLVVGRPITQAADPADAAAAVLAEIAAALS